MISRKCNLKENNKQYLNFNFLNFLLLKTSVLQYLSFENEIARERYLADDRDTGSYCNSPQSCQEETSTDETLTAETLMDKILTDYFVSIMPIIVL